MASPTMTTCEYCGGYLIGTMTHDHHLHPASHAITESELEHRIRYMVGRYWFNDNRGESWFRNVGIGDYCHIYGG